MCMSVYTRVYTHVYMCMQECIHILATIFVIAARMGLKPTNICVYEYLT